MSKLVVAGFFAAAALMVSSGAFADTSRPGVETEAGSDGSYGYKFKDDLLAAGMTGANTAVIKYRNSVVRRTLIRPRTNFVPEMLKSVEQL